MEFRAVEHPKPAPTAAHLKFDDDKDSITIGEDIYIRLSACESVQTEEQNEAGPIPVPRMPILSAITTSGGPSEGIVSTNNDQSGSTNQEGLSRATTGDSSGSIGVDECGGGEYSISITPESQSESRDLDQSVWSGRNDSIESTDENCLRPPPPSQSGTMVRTPSAPILCDLAPHQLRSSIYENGQTDGGFYEPELRFSWSTNISGNHYKVDPPSSRLCRRFDLMVIGITKDDNLPEILLMSTRKDQRCEIFTPRKLSATAYENWGIERRSELKCDIKVHSHDSHYIKFIVTLDTVGEADLVYGKLLEAANYMIFKSSLGHLTTPNERKSTIEEILNEDVCNQFCAECCSKFIGVFDVWMSLASWSMICTRCSNWHRRFVSSARHLWLDDFNPKTWQAFKSCTSSFMSHYWYDDMHPDQLIDGYELLREDLDPILKESVSERHIYAKYCSLKFLKTFPSENNEESMRQLSDLLYMQLKQKDRNVPKLVDLIFRGATLSEIHRRDLMEQMTDDQFCKDLMYLVDFIPKTRAQLAQNVEAFDVNYLLKPRCVKDFFERNSNLKSVTLVYSLEQTDALYNKASVRTYKTEIFELIPFPKESPATNNCEENVPSRFYIGSTLRKDFYNMFLSRLYTVSYKRLAEFISRPRKIGIIQLTEEISNGFCRTCAVLDNFVLYFFDCSEDKQTPYRELDLRFVYSVNKNNSTLSSGSSSTSSLLSSQSEFILKIDYCEAVQAARNKYPVYYFKVEDEDDFESWFKLISDWINVTQSPLLHRQPIEIHHLGMFCNYAVAILIGDKLMPVTCEVGPKKHWLLTSTDSLPAYEKEVLCRFCFKSDMPRIKSSSSRLLGKILSPAAFIQLLVKFTQDHLMIPARFVYKVRKMEERTTLVISGFDPESISPSLNSEAFDSMVNSLSIAYRNTLLELFWYFKVIILRSNDLEVRDVVTWMSEVKFCNNLFSADILRHCLEDFESLFKVSADFLEIRKNQIEIIAGMKIKKPGVTLQVPFIRENWSEYNRANECEYENSLEPIKFKKPDDLDSWTNEQFLDALVNCITPLTGVSTISVSVGARRKEEITFGPPLTYLLIERLTFDKHIVRILPITEQINESLVPFTVVMNGSEFITAFQMLARNMPRESFTADVIKLKWNNVQKQPEKGNTNSLLGFDKEKKSKGMGSCTLSVAVGDKAVEIFKRSSTVPDKLLFLAYYTIYFGIPSKSQKSIWKRSLFIVGDANCYGLTFENPTDMYACFWSLQYHKLGKEGMEKWLPMEKYKMEKMNLPRSRQTIDGCQPYSAGWESQNNYFAASRASNVIFPQQYNNSSNRDNRYVQQDGGEVTANGEVRDGREGGRRSSRYTASVSPHMGRLSKSMDMLQASGVTDRATSSRLSVTRVLKKPFKK